MYGLPSTWGMEFLGHIKVAVNMSAILIFSGLAMDWKINLMLKCGKKYVMDNIWGSNEVAVTNISIIWDGPVFNMVNYFEESL